MPRSSIFRSTLACVALLLVFRAALAQDLSPADHTRINEAVNKVIQQTRVPSVSVGVARGGKVVYAEAFGAAVLPHNVGVKHGDGAEMQISVATTQPAAASPAMAYPIGSISKQFTATCILRLQEQGKLKLDDPVARWFPSFTRASEVTVRNLLTHTSGYSDYAPQDYTIPAWTKPTDPLRLVTEWATKPLDFDPGTKWQYSNTNFEIAALIVEKASGQHFHDFLWQNVITPLKLEGVLDLDTERDQLQVRGYEQHALGPMRPAILEAPGWYYGDAQLAMPVGTLLAWDESIIHRTLLKPESYDAMETEFKLKDGAGSHYGLGVFVRDLPDGDKQIFHSGEVGGFVSNNVLFLKKDIAYAALTNEEASSAAGRVTSALRPIVLSPPAAAPKPAAAKATGTPAEQTNVPAKPSAPDTFVPEVQTIVAGLQEGKLDRSLFTTDAQFYFSAETIEDFRASLAPLGPLTRVEKSTEAQRGGMTFRGYTLRFARGTATLSAYTMPDGKIEQFLIGPSE